MRLNRQALFAVPSYLSLSLLFLHRECLVPYSIFFSMMRIYLHVFVTCFDTVELSLRGVIQVSDHFLFSLHFIFRLFLPSLDVSTRVLTFGFPR